MLVEAGSAPDLAAAVTQSKTRYGREVVECLRALSWTQKRRGAGILWEPPSRCSTNRPYLPQNGAESWAESRSAFLCMLALYPSSCSPLPSTPLTTLPPPARRSALTANGPRCKSLPGAARREGLRRPWTRAHGTPPHAVRLLTIRPSHCGNNRPVSHKRPRLGRFLGIGSIPTVSAAPQLVAHTTRPASARIHTRAGLASPASSYVWGNSNGTFDARGRWTT